MRLTTAVFVLLALAACTQSSASRVNDRTFRIESPSMGMSSEGPNQRLAARVCPSGYRVVDHESHRGGPDRAAAADPTSGVTTTWTIRCI